MSAGIEHEAANVIAPLLNASGHSRLFAVNVTTTSTRFDLTTYLTAAKGGHYLTVTAVGGDVYIAFNNADAGTVDNTVRTAGGATVCDVILTGQTRHFRLVDDYTWMIIQTSTGTAVLRGSIASLNFSQTAADI